MKKSIKSMKNLIIFLIVLIFFLYIWNYFTPVVIKHPEPSLSIDVSPFIEAGCVKKGKYLNCSRIGLEKKYNCDRIVIPSQYLGGLTPKVAMVECEFHAPIKSIAGDNKYFLIDGKCLKSSYRYSIPSYVIVGKILDLRKEKVIGVRYKYECSRYKGWMECERKKIVDKNCSAIKVSTKIKIKRIFKGKLSNNTITIYWYENVTGKCYGESNFTVNIGDKVLVSLAETYFPFCIIKLDNNKFNELVSTPNLSFTEEGIIARGCLAPVYNKYIILTDKGFKVIRNREEFKQFFAPVETPEEALTFAIALTGSFPMYKISIPKNYVVFTPVIETTYVKEVPEGFKVHLFSYKICGCGTHPYYAVDYLVTKTGEVKEISKKKIYLDPTFVACVD